MLEKSVLALCCRSGLSSFKPELFVFELQLFLQYDIAVGEIMYGDVRLPASRLPVCALACFLFDNENQSDNLYPTCGYLSYICRKKVK